MARRGSILTEFLIILMIMVVTLPITVQLIEVTMHVNQHHYEIQDMISSYQLRRILLLSYDIEGNENGLSFEYNGDEFMLNVVNEKLILQPGTQIYYPDIDDGYFINIGNVWCFIYHRDNEEYEIPLTK